MEIKGLTDSNCIDLDDNRLNQVIAYLKKGIGSLDAIATCNFWYFIFLTFIS